MFSPNDNGELNALSRINELKNNSELVNVTDMNVLHLSALKGSVSGIHFAITELKINSLSLDYKGLNILHFAALGGSVPALKYIVEVLLVNPGSVSESGATALHFAAKGGHVEAVKYLRKLSKDRSLQFNTADEDDQGYDVFYYARQSGNFANVKKALTETVAPLSPAVSDAPQALFKKEPQPVVIGISEVKPAVQAKKKGWCFIL